MNLKTYEHRSVDVLPSPPASCFWNRKKKPVLEGTEADLRLAIDSAEEVRSFLLGRENVEGPINDLEPRLWSHGIHVRRTRMLPEKGGPQALLIPRSRDGFDISVDPTPSSACEELTPSLFASLLRHRQRFLVAHELAHSLFFDRCPDGQPYRVEPSTPSEEEFCDEFARWLLLPHHIVRSQPATAASVFKLQRRFDVSVQLAARALYEAHNRKPWFAIAVHRAADEALDWHLQWATVAAPKNLVAGIEDEAFTLAGSGGDGKVTWAYDESRRQLVLVGPMEPDYSGREPQCVSAT